jgi:hypothetical protein
MLRLGRQRLAQVAAVFLVDILHVTQPVVGQTDPLAGHRRVHAGAAVMAAHDHVLDAQHLDGELQHRQAVQVRMRHDVGDIAMNEEFARQQVDDFIGGHAAVGTAYPQIFGRLLRRQLGEELLVLRQHGRGPFAVVPEQLFQFERFLVLVRHVFQSAAGIREYEWKVGHFSRSFQDKSLPCFVVPAKAGTRERGSSALTSKKKPLQCSGFDRLDVR